MNVDQAEGYIYDHVEVGHEMVALAKAFIVENFTPDVVQLTAKWLNHVQAPMPTEVVIHQTVDPEPTLRAAARSISSRLAFSEAVWALIHTNVLLPATGNLHTVTPNLSWTTVVPGSGGQSSGWRFDQLAVSVPDRIQLVPSWKSNSFRPLSEGDLFIRELGIANLHPVVGESLQEAVTCFRYDLYAPCLAMLTRAVEGAWTEMGLALASSIHDINQKRADALSSDLLNPQYSLARRLTRVADVYEQKELCEALWNVANVNPRDLRQVAIWADQVRDSRNVLHYQSQPARANSYEKVAALLIGAVPFMRTIYAVYDAARQLAPPLKV